MADSGLNPVDIEKAGQMLSESKATIACWAMGTNTETELQ